MTDDPYYELINAVQKNQTRRFLGLASYIIYIYDFLLTYSEVQRLIWPSRIGVVKVCYYFNRVMVPIALTVNTWQMSGLAGPLSDTFCQQWFVVSGFMGVILLGVSNMILLLWVHAIYDRRKKVLFGLLAFFIATYAAILVIGTLRIIDLTGQINKYFPPPFACLVSQEHPSLPSTRVVPIDAGFDVLIFCMTLYKSFGHARTVKSISNSPILSTLYRDGLGYFFVIIIIKFVNFLTWYLGKPFNLFGMEFFLGLTTAFISRMLLNLRIASGHCKRGVLDEYELGARRRSGSTNGRA